MAKTKPAAKISGEKKRGGKRGDHRGQRRPDGSIAIKQQAETAEQIYLKACELFCQLQIDRALATARKALDRFQGAYPTDPRAGCAVLLLLGEIYLARGEVELSREHYMKAIEVDPEGRKTGAEPFLWSAQLSEEGGKDSIYWFEKACTILRRELQELQGKGGLEEAEDEILVKTRCQLGEALCSMTEVYMTDLSYDLEAGSKCDALMTEAVLVSPDSPAVLQTLASVRISEHRIDDAKSALVRSMELWKHLPAEDVNIPDFATRISLTRLLLEVEMEAEAVDVVDQLVQEDDQSVEAVYLGAWSRFLLYEKGADAASESRDLFRRCLRLYTSLDYEDEGLRSHTVEMIKTLDDILGPPGEEDNDDEDEWEDDEAVEDEGELEVGDDHGDDHEDASMYDPDTNGSVT